MKKVKLFALAAMILLPSVILFSEKDVLANAAALEQEYEYRVVTCFKTITKDSSKDPLLLLYDCDDCQQYGILKAEESSSCVAKILKRQTEIN